MKQNKLYLVLVALFFSIQVALPVAPLAHAEIVREAESAQRSLLFAQQNAFPHYWLDEVGKKINDFIGMRNHIDHIQFLHTDGRHEIPGDQWTADQLDEVIYQVTGIYNNFAPHWGMQPFAPAILP